MSNLKYKVVNSNNKVEDKKAINLYGGNLEAFKSKEKIVILVGPAGSGKTWSLCLLMHLFCVKYPGVQVLLCRKTLPALRNTVVKTYLNVVEDTGYKEKVRTLGETRPTEFIYEHSEQEWDGIKYSGVSRITLSQIDAQGKALGAEYDMIYVNQPDTEGLTEDEFTLVASRCRAENAPYRKIIADPNPASDQHWLLLGSIPNEQTGEYKWKLYNSTHKDNPRYYDYETGEWTELGLEHLRQLELLPPHLRQSQLEGKWFSTEGTVFGNVFIPHKHILYLQSQRTVDLGISSIVETKVGQFEYIKNNLQGWHNYLSIDWGGTDPYVAILTAHHPTLDLYIVHKHIYISETDIYTVSEMTRQMIDGYEIVSVVTDRGRAEQTVMESIIGYPIITAKKGNNSVMDSINIMNAELMRDKWLFMNTEESLFHEPDPLLIKGNKMMGVEEIPNLRRDSKNGGIAAKQQDHYSDCVRYLMRYLVDLNARPEIPAFVWL